MKFHKLHKIIAEDSGLSLIEMMTTVLIISITSLGIITMVQEMMRGHNNVRLQSDFLNVRNLAATALESNNEDPTQDSCPKALRNNGAVVKYAGGSVDLTEISREKNGAVIPIITKTNGTSYSGYTITKLRLEPAFFNKDVKYYDKPTATWVDYKKWITSVTLEGMKKPNATGGPNYIGAVNMKAQLPLVLFTDPVTGVIKRCALQDPNYAAYCEALGATYDETKTPPCLLRRLGLSDDYPDRDQGLNKLTGNLGLYTKGDLLAGGKMGVGTITPASKLDVSGGAALGSYGGNRTAPANGLIVDGKVGIGTTAPVNPLSVTGNGDFSGKVGIGIAAPPNNLSVNGNTDFSGRVGVGVVSPSTQLDVSGKIWMQPTTTDADPTQTVVTKDYYVKTTFSNKGVCGPRQVMMGFDANGNRICLPSDAVNYANSCGAGYYMVGFDINGAKVCAPLSAIGSCGPLQYMVGVDASGNKICKSLFEVNLCGYRQYMAGVDPWGTPVCRTLAPLGDCGVGRTLRGFDASGNKICSGRVVGGSCPSGRAIASVAADGTATCIPVPAPPATSYPNSVPVYRCPNTMSNSCGNGSWASLGCYGQLSTTTTCHVIIWSDAIGWCDDTKACTYAGRLRLR